MGACARPSAPARKNLAYSLTLALTFTLCAEGKRSRKFHAWLKSFDARAQRGWATVVICLELRPRQVMKKLRPNYDSVVYIPMTGTS